MKAGRCDSLLPRKRSALSTLNFSAKSTGQGVSSDMVRPITLSEKIAGRVALDADMANYSSARVPSVFHQRSHFLVFEMHRYLLSAMLKVLIQDPTLLAYPSLDVGRVTNDLASVESVYLDGGISSFGGVGGIPGGAASGEGVGLNTKAQLAHLESDMVFYFGSRNAPTNILSEPRRRLRYGQGVFWSGVFENILEGARRCVEFLLATGGPKQQQLALATRNPSAVNGCSDFEFVEGRSDVADPLGSKWRSGAPDGEVQNNPLVDHGVEVDQARGRDRLLGLTTTNLLAKEDLSYSGARVDGISVMRDNVCIPLALYLVEAPYASSAGPCGSATYGVRLSSVIPTPTVMSPAQSPRLATAAVGAPDGGTTGLKQVPRTMCSLALGSYGGQYPLGVVPESLVLKDYHRTISTCLEMSVICVYQYCAQPGNNSSGGVLYAVLNFLHEVNTQIADCSQLEPDTLELLNTVEGVLRQRSLLQEGGF